MDVGFHFQWLMYKFALFYKLAKARCTIKISHTFEFQTCYNSKKSYIQMVQEINRTHKDVAWAQGNYKGYWGTLGPVTEGVIASFYRLEKAKKGSRFPTLETERAMGGVLICDKELHHPQEPRDQENGIPQLYSVFYFWSGKHFSLADFNSKSEGKGASWWFPYQLASSGTKVKKKRLKRNLNYLKFNMFRTKLMTFPANLVFIPYFFSHTLLIIR